MTSLVLTARFASEEDMRKHVEEFQASHDSFPIGGTMLIRGIFIALLAVWPPIAHAQEPATRVTVLVDAFGDRADLKKDWGYSVLIEHSGKRVLFDTGNDSELFRHNVETLGINLRDLDFVVISHRHGDHTDGLRYLLGINPDVEIYVPDDEYFGGPTPRAFFARSVETLPTRMRYFDGSVPDPLPHGSPWKHANFHRVNAALEIAPGIRIVRNISSGGAFTETPELSLVLDTPEGQVLVVGCSHPGIERILESVQAQTRPVRLLIGGLHWVTMPDSAVDRLATGLAERWNVQGIAPGHCTGELGFAVLNRLFGRRYRYAGVGTVLTLE
jgi:7,8-dihydropterin-6-yl-methyl-4-(beta-D-ribofuranosyl)aminobenzene 5'-phosphate synthase